MSLVIPGALGGTAMVPMTLTVLCLRQKSKVKGTSKNESVRFPEKEGVRIAVEDSVFECLRAQRHVSLLAFRGTSVLDPPGSFYGLRQQRPHLLEWSISVHPRPEVMWFGPSARFCGCDFCLRRSSCDQSRIRGQPEID
jgi:hypothetical protein